jgi:predicted kinase
MPTPYLIVVHGLPCSGKTLLARYLSRELGFPLICKDDIKEGLFDALGANDTDWSQRLSMAAFSALFKLAEQNLSSGQSVIIEGNFHPDQHNYILSGMAASLKPHVFQILCGAEGSTLQRRQMDRAAGGERHPGHRDGELDPALWESLSAGWEEPLKLPGELLRYDSASRVSRQHAEEIIKTIRGRGTGSLA